MRKVLAVALLDCRRLGFVLVSMALVAGLLPSLVSGLGERVPVADGLFGVIAIVGLALGGYFGNDFAEGKGSFFFARPLPTWALLAGRVGALLAISGVAFIAFMASLWISSSDLSEWSLDILTWDHAAALGASWSLSLFFGLALAARARLWRSGQKRSPRDLIKIPLRLTLSVGAVILIFGLFADLTVRAYRTQTPVRILFGSWVVACLVASWVAIAAGRTESLRIIRFMDLVTYGYVTIATGVIAAAWTYVLHPGPDAIQTVIGASGSSDGRFAYVQTTVDRGDPEHFNPVFVLDVASGQARRLNSDESQGPWTSADGGTMAWSEATPFFFRPITRLLGGAGSLRLRSSSGDVEPLPMPKEFSQDFVGGAFFFNTVHDILPSPGGDVFAIQWARRLTFTSRSRGELSEAQLGPDGPNILAAAFLKSSDLRVARVRQEGRLSVLEVMDIDPNSGLSKALISMAVGTNVRVQFDAQAARALLSSQTSLGRMSVSLLDLSITKGPVQATVLFADAFGPKAMFLADGRIAAMAWGRDHGPLKIFSATGQPLLDIPVGEGIASLVRSEMFPGVLAVRFLRSNGFEHLLIDATNGGVVRQLPRSYYPVRSGRGTPPPPGSPAARLLESTDGKLYELATLTAEPRLLLPLPRQ
jgi:hypothetical protein